MMQTVDRTALEKLERVLEPYRPSDVYTFKVSYVNPELVALSHSLGRNPNYIGSIFTRSLEVRAARILDKENYVSFTPEEKLKEKLSAHARNNSPRVHIIRHATNVPQFEKLSAEIAADYTAVQQHDWEYVKQFTEILRKNKVPPLLTDKRIWQLSGRDLKTALTLLPLVHVHPVKYEHVVDDDAEVH